MADFNFNAIKQIRQRDKDIVYGYMKHIQSSLFSHFEENPYFTLIQLIQDLCLLYFHQVMDSKILTLNEINTFMKLLKNNNKSQFDEFEYNLIYRASVME